MIVNNLYSIRFFLSLLVGMFHFNLTVKSLGLTSWSYGILNQGPFAVLVFFVLSGYLMSLTSETTKASEFYLKRAIRILPLYYLSLMISALVYLIYYNNIALLRPLNNPDNFLFPIFLFPQFLYEFDNSFLGCVEILWSVGVEILFYFMWPILRNLNNSKVFILILLSLLFSFLVPNIFVNYTHFFLAGVYIQRNKVKIKGWILIGATIVLILKLGYSYNQSILIIDKLVEYLCSIILIIVAISAPYNLDKFPYFKRLGDLSYSFYLFHFFGLYAILYMNNGVFDSSFLFFGFLVINLFLAEFFTRLDIIVNKRLKLLILNLDL